MSNWNSKLALAASLALLLISASCVFGENKQSGTETSGREVLSADQARLSVENPDEPIQLDRRDFQSVHKSVRDAWWHVENAYILIEQEKAAVDELLASELPADVRRGQELSEALNGRIERDVFFVNANVEQLFLDAIESEPDNPLNMAAFAYYLMARKRPELPANESDTIVEAEEWMDKAIALWQDESSFYLLKIHILAEQRWAFEYLRSRALEEISIYERLDEIRELFDLAEQYYPGNYYINYYRVTLLMRMLPPEERESSRQEFWQEIHKAYQKRIGIFSYPPPLKPFEYAYRPPYLIMENTDPVYFDHWIRFGTYDRNQVEALVSWLAPDLHWPRDKDEIAALSYMLFQLSRTKPFYQSFFSLQFMIADQVRRNAEPGSVEAAEFTELIKFLNTLYKEAAVDFYEAGLLTDSTMLDLYGVNALERQGMHRENLRRKLTGRHGQYLTKMGEMLGIDFPLPDPGKWSD